MAYIAKLAATYNGNGTVTLRGKTVLYGTPFAITVKADDLDAYNAGTLMQYAFPYLSTDEREILISGYAKDEWQEMFGKTR